MNNSLTDKQEKILAFIAGHWKECGMSPSFLEIQRHFGFGSPNAVSKHIDALVKKGFLATMTDRHGRRRSFKPVGTDADMAGSMVPLLGRIAAGRPIEAIEQADRMLDLSTLGLDNRRGNLFALRVAGESMIDAHICDNDLVIVQRQPTVFDHEVAAVLMDGEATLKYVRQTESGVDLVPANSAMQPIRVAPERVSNFSILGKVVAVIRSDFT